MANKKLENKNVQKSDFALVLESYTRLANIADDVATADDVRERAETLETLAEACTFAVLKKIHEKSASPEIARMRQELARDLKLKTVRYRLDETSTVSYKSKGPNAGQAVSKYDEQTAERLTADRLHDVSDLLAVATIALLEQTARCTDNGEPVDLLAPFTIKTLDKQVYIKSMDSAMVVEKETTGIQEVFKAVRSAIHAEHTATDASRFVYLEQTVTDGDGDEHTAYERLPLYVDLGGYQIDSNGRRTNYTASADDVDKYHETLQALDLTPHQVEILELRMRGYGYLAIAHYLGTSDTAVRNTLKKIQRKYETRVLAGK